MKRKLFLVSVVALAFFALAILGYVTLCLDATVELRRGTFFGYLALRNTAIADFPEHLVAGTKAYFYTSGEPVGIARRILVITMDPVDFGAVSKTTGWFEKRGYIKVRENTPQIDVVLENGESHQIRIQRSENFITITE